MLVLKIFLNLFFFFERGQRHLNLYSNQATGWTILGSNPGRGKNLSYFQNF